MSLIHIFDQRGQHNYYYWGSVRSFSKFKGWKMGWVFTCLADYKVWLTISFPGRVANALWWNFCYKTFLITAIFNRNFTAVLVEKESVRILQNTVEIISVNYIRSCWFWVFFLNPGQNDTFVVVVPRTLGHFVRYPCTVVDCVLWHAFIHTYTYRVCSLRPCSW